MLLPIIAVLTWSALTAYVVYLFLQTRHRERMALIESGADASIFRAESAEKPNLKAGMVLTAIGLGLFGGHVLEEFADMGGVVYAAMVAFTGGVALLIYHRMIPNK